MNACYPKSIITIGNFDGLHLGHRQILKEVIDRAREENGTSVVYTFRPHPQEVLLPKQDLPFINTYDEKIKLLEKIGVQVVVEEPFSREFSTVTPEKFFRDVLVKRLCAHAIYVGYDFGFGKDRAGSLELLKKLCEEEGVDLKFFKPMKINGQICSSSQIRAYIKEGKIAEANSLLGREFFYGGVVVKGDGRGRKLGFATANIHTGSKLWIKEGVYVTISEFKGRRYPSVTNIGRQPTFHAETNAPVVMETHFLDFDQDIYGETVEVHFIDRLRDEVKFGSIDALVAQIQKDIAVARERF